MFGLAQGLDEAGKVEDFDVGGAVVPVVVPADDYVAAGHSPGLARSQSPSPLPQCLDSRTEIVQGHSCLSCPPQQPGSLEILAGLLPDCRQLGVNGDKRVSRY
jgi:hypothetical protein